MIPSVTLPSGSRMPVLGLGCWKIGKDQTATVIREALELGYRHLDCACDYGNEAEVGLGLKSAIASGICHREDVFVTSKLWNTYHHREHVRLAVQRSLHDLQLDYLDLYLIHFPISQAFVPFEERYPPGWFFDPMSSRPAMRFDRVPLAETWAAMEDLVRAGLVRNIGVCNYTTGLMHDLLGYATIRPSVLQVELHPYLTQEKLVRFCHDERIAVTAFSPIGALSYLPIGMATPGESVLEQPVVQLIAAAKGKTPVQVLLRWAIQRGTLPVPKTSQYLHLKQNIDIFDFHLSEKEMHQIGQLNRNRRFNDPGDFCERAFGTFCPIYD